MSLVYSQGEEPRGAGGPGQVVAVAVDVLEEVVVDLRGALAAADDGDGVLGLEGGLVVQVVGVVQEVAAQALAGLRDVRRGAGAEDEFAGAVGLLLPAGQVVGVHDVDLLGLVVLDGGDLVAEAYGVQLGGGPAAVVVVLGAQRIEALADVEGVHPARFLQVVQERERRGRVGEGDQVGHERHLEGAGLQHHAGVPVEGRFVVQEQAVELVDGLGQTGEAEVEGPEADGEEIERGGHVGSPFAGCRSAAGPSARRGRGRGAGRRDGQLAALRAGTGRSAR
ncbi:hypothetical protein SRIMM317S_05191 [Streptomyces rimosus subsp. rimosus]